MEEITLYHHGLPVTRHPLYGARFAIGADPEADLRLAGAACEPGLTLLRAGQGRWQARVGGDEARPVELAPGERLTLGAYAVEYRTATEPEATDERAAASTLGLVGVSLRIGVLRASLLRLAPLGAPVLVRGETGTGKELVAKALHRL